MEPTMASAVLNIAPEGNLSRYLQEIRKFPMLTPEEELSLAHQWRDSQDMEAAHKLVTSHLRLVAKIAMGYRGYGLPVGELISEGNVGMMQAVKRFDPDRGCRLATYAMWWIRAAIQEYVLHSWSLVKIGTTAAQKKLFFNLRRMKAKLEQLDQGDLSPEAVAAIAKELDVPEGEVVDMNRRLGGVDNSLNAMLGGDADSEWLEMLPDERPSQETVVGELEEGQRRRSLLGAALKQLNPREREIVVERRLKDEPATLEELSHRYAVSGERTP